MKIKMRINGENEKNEREKEIREKIKKNEGKYSQGQAGGRQISPGTAVLTKSCKCQKIVMNLVNFQPEICSH